MQEILNIIYQGNSLSQNQTEKLLYNIINKKLSPIQIASALIGMKIRGETVAEIIGATNALLKYVKYFPHPNNIFADITGTGGDGKNTINISTISAIVASTCNIKIIKHGNFCISNTATGSMNFLKKYNLIDINDDHQTYQIKERKKFDQFGICFLCATQYHEILKKIMPIRKKLKTPTLFNIIGPLINPAKPPIILIGVYKKELLSPMIQVLKFFKYHRAAVVHCGGIDEIGLHADTYVAELHNNVINKYTLTYSDFGLNFQPIETSYYHNSQNKDQFDAINFLKGKGKPEHENIIAANVAFLLKLFDNDNLYSNTQLVLEKIRQGIPYNHLLSLQNLNHKL